MASMGVCVCVCRWGWCREGSRAVGSAFCRFSMQGRCGCSQREAERRPLPTHTHCCTHTAYSTMGKVAWLELYTSALFFFFFSPSLQSFFTSRVHSFSLFFFFFFPPLSVSLTQCVFSSWLPPCCKNIQYPVPSFDLNPLFSLSSLPLLFCACLPSDLLILLAFCSLVWGSDDCWMLDSRDWLWFTDSKSSEKKKREKKTQTKLSSALPGPCGFRICKKKRRY